MKLNFWQWLGIILLILGVIGYATCREKATTPTSAPATQSQY